MGNPSHQKQPSDGEARVPLRVLGLSVNKIQGTAYALILAQKNGPLRVPVVIGASEAQAIALALEGMKLMRPLTHDLFVSLGHAFGIRPTEVMIYKFEDGVFYSEITFTDGERTVSLDARTSDAIAIAIRYGTPIYASREVMEEAAFELEEVSPVAEGRSDEDADDDGIIDPESYDDADTSHSPAGNTEPKLENYAVEELERTLERLIAEEKYEEAARVSEILNRKKNS
ncbi:MAG: bifunctional nuclease family protein [Duncaniella sp.]|nr:bifunctional nuclease family protein [Duncaniella sp.]